MSNDISTTDSYARERAISGLKANLCVLSSQELSPAARMLYVLGWLVVDHDGFIDQNAVAEASEDDSMLRLACEVVLEVVLGVAVTFSSDVQP